MIHTHGAGKAVVPYRSGGPSRPSPEGSATASTSTSTGAGTADLGASAAFALLGALGRSTWFAWGLAMSIAQITIGVHAMQLLIEGLALLFIAAVAAFVRQIIQRAREERKARVYQDGWRNFYAALDSHHLLDDPHVRRLLADARDELPLDLYPDLLRVMTAASTQLPAPSVTAEVVEEPGEDIAGHGRRAS